MKMLTENFSMNKGRDVAIRFPSVMDAEEFADFEAYTQILLRKIKRWSLEAENVEPVPPDTQDVPT